MLLASLKQCYENQVKQHDGRTAAQAKQQFVIRGVARTQATQAQASAGWWGWAYCKCTQ